MKRSKRSLMTIGLLGAIGIVPIAFSTFAHANNTDVEVGMQNSGDLSMFYHALQSTGVINQLNENEGYTIFAPVNAAFAQIPYTNYPCFYSAQCRPEIAAIVRNHIVTGNHDLADLVTYGSGIQTSGVRRVHVDEPFVKDYAVENRHILSKEEVGNSVIYRIDGVITNPQELAQFQTVPVAPVADTVTTEKTVVKTTYHAPLTTPQPYPAGAGVVVPGSVSETTTVTHTYSGDTE